MGGLKQKTLYHSLLFAWRKFGFRFKENRKGASKFLWNEAMAIDMDATQIIYIDDLNLAYMAVPKVANSSIKTLMAKHLCLIGDDDRKGGLAYLFNHPETSADLRKRGMLISKTELLQLKNSNRNLKVLSVVRDPIERVMSFYSSCLASEVLMNQLIQFYGSDVFYTVMSFEQFLQQVILIPDLISNRHFQSQYLFLTSRGNVIADEVYNFNQLSSHFIPRLKELGLDISSFKNVNKGQRKGSVQLREELENKARIRFQKDYLLLEKL